MNEVLESLGAVVAIIFSAIIVLFLIAILVRFAFETKWGE